MHTVSDLMTLCHRRTTPLIALSSYMPLASLSKYGDPRSSHSSTTIARPCRANQVILQVRRKRQLPHDETHWAQKRPVNLRSPPCRDTLRLRLLPRCTARIRGRISQRHSQTMLYRRYLQKLCRNLCLTLIGSHLSLPSTLRSTS